MKQDTRPFSICVIALMLLLSVGGCGYVNYKVYHQKYPNTGFWTWFFDQHK